MSEPRSTQQTPTPRLLAVAARLSHRGWLWIAIALGCAVNAPSLSLQLHGDDFLQGPEIMRHLRGEPTDHPWYEVFGFRNHEGEALIRREIALGIQPWWTDLHQSQALFRPLSAITHYLDYALWPTHYALMHLHNLLWYALLLLSVARLYEVIGPPLVNRPGDTSAAALLALVLYAVDDAHAGTVGWIAARNTIISGVASVLVLVYHHKASRDERRWQESLAACCAFACALLASEGAIALWGYLVCHALWLDSRLVYRRLRALVPLVVVTALWQMAYRSLGFGVHGSGIYLDPLADMSEFFIQLFPRASGLWLEQFGLPSSIAFETLHPLPWLRPVSWAMSLMVAAVLAPYVLRDRGDRFWFFSCLLSFAPYCVFVPEPRLLILPSIGGCAVLARWVVRVFHSHVPAWSRAVAIIVLLVHLPLAAALATLQPKHQRRADWVVSMMALTLPLGPEVKDKTLFVLNTSNLLFAGYSLMARMAMEPRPRATFLLGASIEPVRLTRLHPDVIRLEPRSGYLREPTSLWVRSPRARFEPGYIVQVGNGWVQVESITPDGRPAAIRVFMPEMDGPNSLWFVARAGFFRQTLPNVGDSVEL